jgi:hypothetical protein
MRTRTEFFTGNLKNSDTKYEIVNENFENIYFKMMSQIKYSGFMPTEVKYFSDSKELIREEIPFYLQAKKIESDNLKNNLFDSNNKIIEPENLTLSIISVKIKSVGIRNSKVVKLFEGQIHIDNNRINFSLICKGYSAEMVNKMKPNVLENKKKRVQKLREKISQQEGKINKIRDRIQKYESWIAKESEKISNAEAVQSN